MASKGGGLLLWTITVKADLRTIESSNIMVRQRLFWEEVQEKSPAENVPAFWDANGKGSPVRKKLHKA